MNITDILPEDMVFTDVEAGSKRELLEHVSAFIARKAKLDPSVVFEVIWERENLGSTGYGNGMALPHARLDGLNTMIGAFVRLHRPMDFDALDAQPVDLLAFLLSPEDSGEDHLKALSMFSRVLKDEKVREKVRHAKSKHEIYELLQ